MVPSPPYWPSPLRTALLAGLVPLLVACGPSLDEAYMAKDSGGTKAKRFTNGDEIHCIAVFVGGDEDTLVSFNLIGDPRLILSEDEVYPRPTSKVQGPVNIDLKLFTPGPMGERLLNGPWPTGDYTMEISIDDELAETLDFTVE